MFFGNLAKGGDFAGLVGGSQFGALAQAQGTGAWVVEICAVRDEALDINRVQFSQGGFSQE